MLNAKEKVKILFESIFMEGPGERWKIHISFNAFVLQILLQNLFCLVSCYKVMIYMKKVIQAYVLTIASSLVLLVPDC